MRKNGFTLTETMIVLIILGVISMIVLPPVIKKYQEAVNRAKIKKAMSAYDTAISKMVIENELKTLAALNAWANGNNCENSSQYFKKIDGDGCIFKTSDGVWWNIEDISRAIVAFKEINNDNRGTISTAAKNPDDNSAFVLVTSFDDNGSTRVDDLSYETNHPTFRSNVLVGKLYDFINNSGKVCDILCKYKRGDFTTPCETNVKESCTVTTYNSSGVGTAKIYNAEGKQVGTVTINAQGVTTKEVITNDDGSKTTISYRADGTKSQETIEKYDSTGKNGTRADIIYYADGVTVKSEGSQQKVDGAWGCGSVTEYYESGKLKAETELVDSGGRNDYLGTGVTRHSWKHYKTTTYNEDGTIKSYVENLANTGDNKDEYPTTNISKSYSNGILTSATHSDYKGGDMNANYTFTTTEYYSNGSTKSVYSGTRLGGTGYNSTYVADSYNKTVYYEDGSVKAEIVYGNPKQQFRDYFTTNLYNSNGQKVATVEQTRYDESLPRDPDRNTKTVITWYNESGSVMAKDVSEYSAATVLNVYKDLSDNILYQGNYSAVTNPNPTSNNYRITYDSSGNEVIDNNPKKTAGSINHNTLCSAEYSGTCANGYNFNMMPSW